METYYIHPLPCLSDNLKFAFSMKYKLLSLGNLLAPILHAATVALGGAIPVNARHQAQAVYVFIDSSASRPSLADALFSRSSNLANPRLGDFCVFIQSYS